ncbi:helix-turn-helix domain-containing protein [soil metagenome]
MTEPLGTPDAILRPTEAERAIDVERVPAGEALAPYVDYHWYVGWRTVEPHRQQVVPQPRVHLAAEDGRLLVHGISREPFFRTLSGTGHTIGAAFHPGGLRPFLDRGVGSVSDTVVPAGDLFGVDDRPVAAYVLGGVTVPEMVAALEDYLVSLAPRVDPVVDDVRALVLAAEEDHGITRAEQLAERASMSLRSLQRLFTDYVGVGPKWVIARFRILDVAAAAHAAQGDDEVDWSALAVELGFTDQAHLTRAFTSVVGTPPATYSREA